MKKILSLAFLIVMASQIQAQTIYYVKVASGSDASSGTSWSNAFRNLTKALAAANASTASEVQIWIADGTYTPEDGVSSLPTDHQDTSFAFYRGNGVGRALKVYGGFAGTESSISARDTVHPTYLDGIISTGNSYHVGVIAGLSASADSVVLDGLTFSNGIAIGGTSAYKAYNGYYIPRSMGGGLSIVGDSSARIAIRNCSFISNTANMTGYYTSGWTVPAGAGGAAYIIASFGCSFDRCKFMNNSSLGDAAYSSGSTMSGGAGYGGALYINSDNVKVRNSIFDNNYGRGASVGYSGWGYRTGGAGAGGAIAVVSANNCTIDGCTFTRNYAKSGLGDQIGESLGGAVYTSNAQAKVKNSSFTGCYNTDTGLIYYYSYSYTACGEKHGGAIASVNSACKLDSNVFNQNANRTYATGETFGGAIFSGYSSDTISNSTITGNSSTYGGGIACHGGRPLITNCSIRKNQAAAASIFTNYSVPTIVKCVIDSNSGPGVSELNSVMHIVNCKITNNAGGVVSKLSNLYLDTCVFTGNAADYGGALWTADTMVAPVHCTFSNNTATYEGGAVYSGSVGSFVSSFKSNGNVFVKNRAGKGGAISINTCTTCNDTLLNNIFAGNKNTDNTLGGGAIVVGGSRNYIHNNTFIADTATGMGGAIRVEGTGGLFRAANNIFYKSSGSGTSTDTSIAGTGSIVFYNNIYSSTNPQFMDTTNLRGADTTWGTTDDGIRLRSCSPGINTGNNSYVLATELVDIAGNMRINESIVDIGAFENGNLGTITGPSAICVGTTATYTDTTSGGSWASSNPSVATVSTTGVVRGVSQGTITLSYTATSSCGGSALSTIRTITVERPVSAIVGTDTICRGSTTSLTDTAIGGVWASSNSAIATVNATGLVTGVSQGVDTISYSVTNSCGTSTATRSVVVQRPASLISGTTVLCRGTVSAFTDSAVGGTWSVSNTVVATVSTTGMLTARAPGMDSIIYTLSNVCGSFLAYEYVYVERAPSAIVLVVGDSICTGSGFIYPTDSVSGGIWHVSNHTVLYLYDSTSGIFQSTSVPGRDTLSHTVTNSCGSFTVSKVMTVVGYGVGSIYGRDSVCVGDTVVLHDTAYSGASWSSGDATIATVSPSGVVTGVNGGLVTISYSIINACGLQLATFDLFVKSPPTGVSVTGSASVCLGGTTTLSASPSGGAWSAVNTNASVTSAGLVSGLVLGLDTINYAVSNACGVTTYPYLISVITLPVAATISGSDTVCQGSTVTLTGSVSGGAWSRVFGNVSVVGGNVTGITPGVDTIKYTLTNMCGSAVAVFPITIYSTGYCDSATSVDLVHTLKPEFTLYPNPATNAITIKLASAGTESVAVTMTNIVGEKVGEWQTVTNKATDMQLNLVPGLYILTATTGSTTFVKKVVVE